MPRRGPITASMAAVAVVALAPAASASGGGVLAPPGSGGGTYYVKGLNTKPNPQDEPAPGTKKPRPKTKKPKKKAERRAPRGRGPTLTDFKLVRPHLFLYGRPGRATFRIAGRTTRTVRVRLYLKPLRRGRSSYTVSLATWRARQTVSVPVTGRERGTLRDGRYVLRISARDGRGRKLRRAPGASSTADLTFRGHRFPLTGSGWDLGGVNGRFGAGRPGHRHQGQDISAPQGTPIVAPRGGTVKAVEYQAGGAGHYVVLSARGEDRDYVFMHLRTGSTRVRPGQRIRTGQRIGDVGTTGSSTGAHLHFEMWAGGGWYTGGHPVDPLPYLRAWSR